MIPELGHFALILALLLALIQGILPLLGAQRHQDGLLALAVPAARGQFLFIALAFAALSYSFLTNDFSVKNVAHNSFSRLPLAYRITATWGSHEGSMLLWVLIQSGWATALTLFAPGLPRLLLARVLGVLGLVNLGLLAFLLFASNPFARLLPAPADGADLNPLLQDLGMILHPPMLYMGYVGFSVAFAFALAALIAGRMDAAWARWARPWTLAAWSCLTSGVALGSWWAYRELGWGGWWFWDPTENASFMPWLAGTALVHSLAVTARRGQFMGWTLLLAIGTFSLSLVGTFLVRSGVLSSVHAFALDPQRGIFILVFLGLTIGGSLLLYGWRSISLPPPAAFGWLSRESLLLANNLLLLAALATVLLGTLYPLFLDVLGLGKVSVGPPYYNAVFVPLMLPLLLLMAAGPLTPWGQGRMTDLWLRLRWALVSCLLLALAPLAWLDRPRPLASIGLFLGLWILAGLLLQLHGRLRQAGWHPGRLPRRLWGMQLAHGGMAVLVIGISLVSSYSLERDLRMEVGDHAELAGYRLVFQGAKGEQGPNYVADRATLEVSRGDERFFLYPEKRKYQVSSIGMTEADLHSTLTHDLYVALGEFLGGRAWSLRLFYKPFIGWLWAGALLMVLGGLLATSDRGQRPAPEPVGQEPIPGTPA